MATTTERLVKGMYRAPSPADKPPSPLFGLRAGQARTPWFIKGAGWYNRKGERLGWGDLRAEEVLHIRNNLEDGEFFILLPEGLTHCRNPNIDADAPGIEYVAKYATHIISREKVCEVLNRAGEHNFFQDGLLMHTLSKDKVREMLCA